MGIYDCGSERISYGTLSQRRMPSATCLCNHRRPHLLCEEFVFKDSHKKGTPFEETNLPGDDSTTDIMAVAVNADQHHRFYSLYM